MSSMLFIGKNRLRDRWEGRLIGRNWVVELGGSGAFKEVKLARWWGWRGQLVVILVWAALAGYFTEGASLGPLGFGLAVTSTPAPGRCS